MLPMLFAGVGSSEIASYRRYPECTRLKAFLPLYLFLFGGCEGAEPEIAVPPPADGTSLTDCEEGG